MTPIAIDPELANLGLMVCAIEATAATPGADGQQAYRKLREETLAELNRRESAREIPPTIAAQESLQRRYRGRSKQVDPSPVRVAKDLLRNKLRPIHPIVDVYNLWSAQLGLSMGAFDVDRIHGSISVRLTNGTERFQPIGAPEHKTVEAGGFAYVDESGEVLCWLDVRQGDPAKLTVATRTALILIEGVPPYSSQELAEVGKRVSESLLETGAASAVRIY